MLGARRWLTVMMAVIEIHTVKSINAEMMVLSDIYKSLIFAELCSSWQIGLESVNSFSE